MMRLRPSCTALWWLLILGWLAHHPGSAADQANGQEPPSIPADARSAVQGFVLAEGITAEIYAAEPLVSNPVAIFVDHDGKMFVCETFRQKKGVEDNRDHPEWVDDDLAAQTVADRLDYFRKHLGDRLESYSQSEDRLRLLVDTDGDDRADKATVFADGFNGPLDGTGAGVLAHQGNVYYSCIPKLYLFRDENRDGVADHDEVLADGFGVRVAFRGHDLHGLTLGPDGRIYFTVGDRGYHVETEHGVLANPESGAVFRCEPDGSHLEVIATGLRNPQELAFDDLGNLFTGDNNSDSGDQARWVHVLEGGDSGWRMAYQYLPDRGPWNQERLWEPYHPGQPAYIVPPVANFADGPSGLTYYPGTGLSDHYIGNFFLCDFRGQTGQSGVRTFKVRPQGATFTLIDPEVFLWNCLVTDIAFGPDGAAYVSDWVEGWDGTGKGRIYRLTDAMAQQSPIVAEVRKLLQASSDRFDASELAEHLAHADRRVRMKAQLELVNRGDEETLLKIARKSQHQLARFHAVHGLGQLARAGHENLKFMEGVSPLLRDVDPEIRAVTATIMGNAEYANEADTLVQLLQDESARVQAAAAIALGKLKHRDAVDALGQLLEQNQDADPAVRHAAVMGLVGCARSAELEELGEDDHRSVRLGALLAMRRRADPKIVMFLSDDDEAIVTEAALAIYDVPIAEGMTELAQLISRPTQSLPLLRRIVAANYRQGTPRNAVALAQYAADVERPLAIRLQAMRLLGIWEAASGRDPVLGMWRPIESRSQDIMKQVMRRMLPELVRSGLEVRLQAVRLAASLGLGDAGPLLVELLDDRALDAAERAGVLLALDTLDPPNLDAIIAAKLKDSEPRVRAAARILLTRRHPDRALEQLTAAIDNGQPVERKSAMQLIANLGTPAADARIAQAMEQLNQKNTPLDTQLEVLMAARRRRDNPQIAQLLDVYDNSVPTNDPLAPFRVALEGGNAERGELLFRHHLALSCVRCHKVSGSGGEVGPDLSKIGADKSREYLLESLVEPNKTIAKGFETVVLELEDGSVRAGIVQQESGETLTLIDAEGRVHEIETSQIVDRAQGQSAMPVDLLRHMTLYDLRDLVEYLSTLK